MFRGFGKAVCDLLGEGLPRAKIEIAENRGAVAGIGIPLIIPAQTQSEGEVFPDLPCVFCKQTLRSRGGTPRPQDRLTGQRAVHHARFQGGSILGKGHKIIETKAWLRARPLKGLQIVAEPTLVPDLQYVRTADVGEHIAPVIVVLNKSALRKTDSIAIRLPDHRDRRHAEIAGLVVVALNPVGGEDRFVQPGGRKRVRPVALKGAFPIRIFGQKLRNGIAGSGVENCRKKLP